MNKLYLLSICLLSITNLYSQDLITEENYLKEDSIIWMNYEKRQEELSQIWETMPEKKIVFSAFLMTFIKRYQKQI